MGIRFSSPVLIVALRNEKGSYNAWSLQARVAIIVALRNEKGSYNGFPEMES